MQYTDTRNRLVKTTFREAVTSGMSAITGGLYIPVEYPRLETEFLHRVPAPCFRDTAYQMAKVYVGDEISDRDLMGIIEDAYPFSPKLYPLDSITYALELYHGPTCAFKDFGARFMARVMAYFNRNETGNLHILVATSGDTGSAVGSAFLGLEGIDVTILYPQGKVSELQEKQLTTFTGNVRALRVAGTFDDCQRLVKRAFTDKELRAALRLSSANSINIARLLPQSFYYMAAALAARDRCAIDNRIDNPAIIMAVPSGNFGNLTSGLVAYKMGAPITGFIAATNTNHTVPDWIATGKYHPRPSVETLANAMDVGAPSNFERLNAMYSLDEVRHFMASYWLGNNGIKNAITLCHNKTGYITDPHSAIAWKAWDDIRGGAFSLSANRDPDTPGITPNVPDWASTIAEKRAVGIILQTASPAKFSDTVYQAVGREPPMPDRLSQVLRLTDLSIPMENNYDAFKAWLMDTLH